MKTIENIIFWFLSPLLFFSAAVCPALEVDGDIFSDTTWALAQSPVTINKADFTVQSSAVLTIEAGVVVRVSDKFISRGTLRVNGEAGGTVIFEERDEGLGWGYLKFGRDSFTNPNRLEYADLRDLESIWVSEQSAAFNHCTVIVTGPEKYVLRSFGGLYKPYPDLLLEISDCFFSLDSSYSLGFTSSVSAILLDGTDAAITGSTILCEATAANTEVAGCRFHETNTGAYQVEFSGNTVEVTGSHPDIYTTYGVYYEDASGSFTENTVISEGPREVRGLDYSHNSSLCRGNKIYAVSSGGGAGSYLYGIYSIANSLGDADLIVDNRVDLETDSDSRYLRGIFMQTGAVRGNRISCIHNGEGSSSVYGLIQQYYSGSIESNSFRLSAAAGVSCRGVVISTNYNSSNRISVKNNILSAPGVTGETGVYKDSGCQAEGENSYNLIHNFTAQFTGLTAGPGTISADPDFADLELHLNSGSPAIDAGDPASPFSAEPAPNGGRINLGAYGNSSQAALSGQLPTPAPAGETPSPSPSRTPAPSPTGVDTPVSSPSPSLIPTPSPLIVKTPTPTASPAVVPTPRTPTPTATRTSTPTFSPTPTSSPTPVELTLFRPDSGLWAVRGKTRFYFGDPGDQPLKADCDGDGTRDFGLFRESVGLWTFREVTRFYFGGAGDIPIREYDQEGNFIPAVFRPSAGLWAQRGGERVYFNPGSAQPVPGDYDGDSSSDPSIYLSSSGLWILKGLSRFYYGRSDDIPLGIVRRDRAVPAVFRAENGLWALRGESRIYFGRLFDLPVDFDYDGNGTGELAIYRGSSGLWAARNGFRVYFGREGDIPVR